MLMYDPCHAESSLTIGCRDDRQVVLMRRSTRATARLHVHTQWTVLGVMDLASVFRIDRLDSRAHDLVVLKLDAVDTST